MKMNMNINMSIMKIMMVMMNFKINMKIRVNMKVMMMVMVITRTTTLIHVFSHPSLSRSVVPQENPGTTPTAKAFKRVTLKENMATFVWTARHSKFKNACDQK